MKEEYKSWVAKGHKTISVRKATFITMIILMIRYLGGIYLLVCMFIFVTWSNSLKKSIQEFTMWSRQPSMYYSPLFFSDNFWDYRHEGQLPYQLVVIKGEKTVTIYSKNPHQNVTVMQIDHI